jgi:Na+-transporting NADH:ubiquinone oxidoreductase subunit NqrC
MTKQINCISGATHLEAGVDENFEFRFLEKCWVHLLTAVYR